MSKTRDQRMTAKRREVMSLLARGYTSKEIAKALGVSASAIDQRIDGAVRAAGVADRRALVRWHLDGSDQLTAEAAQVASNPAEPATSASDQTTMNMGLRAAANVAAAPPPQIVVVTVPEIGRGWLRQGIALEAALFATLIILAVRSLIELAA